MQGYFVWHLAIPTSDNIKSKTNRLKIVIYLYSNSIVDSNRHTPRSKRIEHSSDKGIPKKKNEKLNRESAAHVIGFRR